MNWNKFTIGELNNFSKNSRGTSTFKCFTHHYQAVYENHPEILFTWPFIRKVTKIQISSHLIFFKSFMLKLKYLNRFSWIYEYIKYIFIINLIPTNIFKLLLLIFIYLYFINFNLISIIKSNIKSIWYMW